jgi:hypothetical protein
MLALVFLLLVLLAVVYMAVVGVVEDHLVTWFQKAAMVQCVLSAQALLANSQALA